jgi:hypothetical protein
VWKRPGDPLILGIAITRSRAGLLLGMLAVFGSLPIVMSLRMQRGTKRILALAVGIALCCRCSLR